MAKKKARVYPDGANGSRAMARRRAQLAAGHIEAGYVPSLNHRRGLPQHKARRVA